MVSQPPYLVATSIRDIVSEADLLMILIFEAASLSVIKSTTDGLATILPMLESDVVKVSNALAAVARIADEESDREKLSDALVR
jgi:hypothetical protein